MPSLLCAVCVCVCVCVCVYEGGGSNNVPNPVKALRASDTEPLKTNYTHFSCSYIRHIFFLHSSHCSLSSPSFLLFVFVSSPVSSLRQYRVLHHFFPLLPSNVGFFHIKTGCFVFSFCPMMGNNLKFIIKYLQLLTF